MNLLYDETTPLSGRDSIPKFPSDNRRSYEKKLAVYLILASTLFERIAFYSIAAILVNNLESNQLLHWQSPNGSIAAFIFSGTSYISTLIFAVISDAKLGRTKSIITGYFLYFIGYVLATLISNQDIQICTNSTSNNNHPLNNTLFNEPCAGWILGALIIISIGAGAVQSNMAVFGAEQIQESKITSRYFDKYMIAINIGGILAMLVIPSVQYGDTHNVFIGYIVVTSLLFVAALLFIVGCRYYIHIQPYDTVAAKCIPVMINAFQTWRKYKQNQRTTSKLHNKTDSLNTSHVFEHVSETEDSIRIDERPATFLDFAKAANQGKFQDRIVNDVKSLKNALIVFSLLIPYWLIYSQINTTFLVQGQHMHKPPDVKNIITLMSLGDPVTIIIGIIILNAFVYKYFDVQHRASLITTKFVTGMAFAVITMCIAGIVEHFRRQQCSDTYDNNDSSLSIYYLLPQNIAMGLSEVFVMMASYEYAYFAAPRSAQSLFMSLRFCSIGVSSFISTAYVAVFPTPSFKLDFSCRFEEQFNWSFYTYFFILAALQLIFLIIFIISDGFFRIVKFSPQQIDESQHFQRSSSTSFRR